MAGGAAGAAAGGIGEIVIRVAAITVPGIGPIVAAGTPATVLAGVGAGAVTEGVGGALIEAVIPPGEADHDAESLRRGGGGVLVKVEDDEARARAVLAHSAPVDREARNGVARGGWSAFDEGGAAWTTVDLRRERERRRDRAA